ncbi:COG1525 Micrococcal nuclease (thermonuclease) homologs [Sphingomonadaceae bacterium]
MGREHSAFDRFDKPTTQATTSMMPSLAGDQKALENDEKRALKAGEQILSQVIVRTKIERCREVRDTCVVDGDTLWLQGLKIRVADIDTPEISRPKCAQEARLGRLATDRLIELLNAGPLTMVASDGPDEDRYGRKLRVFLRDGESVGMQLVKEGLAREWDGRQRPWC